MVQGIAGTGKSYFIREVLLRALEAQGKLVTATALTHNAASVIEGKTTEHWGHKHVRAGAETRDVLWID